MLEVAFGEAPLYPEERLQRIGIVDSFDYFRCEEGDLVLGQMCCMRIDLSA
ncbi:hypothetical protein D3C81_2135870 [compost metagenome]